MKEGRKEGVTPDGPKMAPSASQSAQSCALGGKIGLSLTPNVQKSDWVDDGAGGPCESRGLCAIFRMSPK